eukprot:1168787-Prymnesium_polylepis.1
MLRGAAGLQYLQCRCATCPGPAAYVSSHGPWTFAVRETRERAARCLRHVECLGGARLNSR